MSEKFEDDKKVGVLYILENYFIFKDGNGEFYTINEKTGKKLDFSWEERISYLCKPWSTVHYYQDDEGYHYSCPVYDGIEIDIFADTIENLMQLLCEMLEPTDEMMDIICDRMEKQAAEINKDDSDSSN